MNKPAEFDEYLEELRAEVCSHCIERRVDCPPCSSHGKNCGIEQHVPELVQLCRTTHSALMDPYIDELHSLICPHCAYRNTPNCPCPLDYLLPLAIEAVEQVELRSALRPTALTSEPVH